LDGVWGVCRQDWYEKRGYVCFEIVKDYLKGTDENGEAWSKDFVWMKKMIGDGEEEAGEERIEEKRIGELLHEAREEGIVAPSI